jgi:hypothetical protein
MTSTEMVAKLREEAEATRNNYVFKLVMDDTSQPAHLEKQEKMNQLLIMEALAMLLEGVGDKPTAMW